MASPQLNNRLGFIDPGLALSHGCWFPCENCHSMNIFTLFRSLNFCRQRRERRLRDRSNNKKQQRNRHNNYFLRVIPPTDNVSIWQYLTYSPTFCLAFIPTVYLLPILTCIPTIPVAYLRYVCILSALLAFCSSFFSLPFSFSKPSASKV